jgi:hypothetical protein
VLILKCSGLLRQAWLMMQHAVLLEYQEVDCGLELYKFSAIPSRVPEKTLSGHVVEFCNPQQCSTAAA